MAKEYISRKEFLKHLYGIYAMHQWSTGEAHFSWNDIQGNAEACDEMEDAISISDIIVTFNWACRKSEYSIDDVIFSYDDVKEYIEKGYIPDIPKDTWEMNGGL